MKNRIVCLFVGVYSLLLTTSCASLVSSKEKGIYISNLSRLNYTCHDGYVVVIPCGENKIVVQQVYWLLVDYGYKKNAPQYKTFKEYLMGTLKNPGLYDCGESGGYPYKNTDVYNDYLKIGFDAFLRKYTEEEQFQSLNQKSNYRIFKKDIEHEWAQKPGWEVFAAVKILFDHQYYIKEVDSLVFCFTKTFQECESLPPLSPVKRNMHP